MSPSLRSNQAAALASDTLEGLPKALRALGVKVTVVVPMSDDVRETGLMLARRLTKIETPAGVKAVLHEGRLANQADLAVLELPEGQHDSFASVAGAYAAVKGLTAVYTVSADGTDVNAIDAGAWNPATDPKLAHRYNPFRLWAKKMNQGLLAEELGMTPDAALPFFLVWADASSEQFAKELVAAGLKYPAQWLVCTPAADTGLVASWFSELGDAVKVVVERSDDQIRRALGSATLMVWARGSACPTSLALRALRYGTIPVLPAACGGAWTVNIDPAAQSGNAVSFGAMENDGAGEALVRALALTMLPAWESLQRRAMSWESGWEREARALKRRFGGNTVEAAV